VVAVGVVALHEQLIRVPDTGKVGTVRDFQGGIVFGESRCRRR
jgi:hypothetical protein